MTERTSGAVESRRGRRRSSSQQSVLVAFDYRDFVPEVMGTAARLAGDDHGRGIHVMVTIPVATRVALDEPMPNEESIAESVLEEIRVQIGRRVTGHWAKVRDRQAGSQIVREARSLGVGTLVMPAAPVGRGQWSHTVETVMRERPCQVVIEAVPAALRVPGSSLRVAARPSEDSDGRTPELVVAESGRQPALPTAMSPSGAALRPWENVPVAEATPQSDPAADDNEDVILHASKLVLALGALGIVYGDLGTSPLYTEQTIYGLHAAHKITTGNVYGITSLIFWSLTLIISFKYATLIMKAHNRGDGGGMALAMMIRRHKVAHSVALVTLGIIGASLFLGDGVITPAISVLSAVGGLSVVSSSFTHLVIPIALVILVFLFVIQRQGSAVVGRFFGPIMLLWFAVIGVIGISGIASDPSVVQALLPTWGVEFFIKHGLDSFLTFGGVVLCVTGAEALYADRGHFGPGAIRMSWFFIVMPSVVLNYLGQSAHVLQHHADKKNPFFQSVPHWGLVPLVILSTVATVIASQAVISGSFSVARQAMRLGYLPRLKIIHTSDFEGQIYIPAINWSLAAGVIVLVLIFKTSGRLANAYGVAVTGTFLIDTALFLAVAHYIWHRPRWQLIGIAVLLWSVEAAFLLSNLAKVLHGAWVPLLTAAVLTSVMLIWNRGRGIVTRNRTEREGPMVEFISELEVADPPLNRVPGVGIFMSPGRDTTPLAMRAALEYTNTLHAKVLVVSLVHASVPRVREEDRFKIEQLGPKSLAMRHVWIRVGYQERIEVPEALKAARTDLRLERELNLEHAAYFISQIVVIEDEDSEMPKWQEKLFLTMARNANGAADEFGLPDERTVSLGGQIPA